jgi:hypothetical protein
VWASLEALQWNGLQAAGSRLRHLRYVAYGDAVHRWAEILQTEPEALEFILFDRRGAL